METERLAAIPLFADLPPDELAVVASVAGELDVPVGNTVMKEGDFGHTVFAVERGTADVIVDGATVSSVGPGEVIGEIAVLASGRRTASVVTTSPMRLLSFFKRDVWKLEDRAPEAARRLRELIGAHNAPTG